MPANDNKYSVYAFRCLCVLCVAVAVLAFGGIYDDYHEIEKIDLLQVIGIDHQDDMVELTALGSQKSGEKPTLYRGAGEAMNRAAANMQTEAGAEYLHFGHVKYIIISKEAAREKISDVLDYCIRMPDIGLNAAMYYVDTSAGETMSNLEDGQNLSKILEAMAMKGRDTSAMYSYTLMDIITCLKRNGFALSSAFEVKEGQVVPMGTAVLPEQGDPVLLNDDETSMLALLNGRLKSFSQVVEGEDSKGVGVDISETEVKYRLTRGEVAWTLSTEITLQCGLDELYTQQEMLDRQGIIEIEAAVEKKIQGQVEELIAKSKEIGIDFCQMGQKAYMLSGQESRDRFMEMKYEVKVNASINRTYAIGEGADNEG